MRSTSLTALPLLLAPALHALPAQDAVTTPEEHLGRPLARDFELADWEEVSSYHRRLAGESPRVLAETVGTTTEGRDFLLTVVSGEENLARLDELKDAARRVADPRGLSAEEREEVLDAAVPFLFVSLGMHSTETAAPQFGMELAHRLATSDEEPYASARRELVVLIAPCLNPDGLDHVVEWYRETVGTPYEAADMPKLYQLYTGHDNNRDWFMLTQNETRIVTRLLYSEWFPQVYWDVHQQGSSRERFFVPPFRDPLNPNLDPAIIAAIGQLGSRALLDMTRAGLTGVSTGVTYDMWWNGGNRNVPVRHNIAGLLTEAASVNLASPIFLSRQDLRAPRGIEEYAPSNRFPAPWPGGWWRLRDIVEYEHAFARSLLASLAREPRLWLENAMEAAAREIREAAEDAPRAWLVPPTGQDVGATRRLLDALFLAGVEIHAARRDFAADGRRWPAGTLVIPTEQPYGAHARDLLEVQRYPDGPPPYDVSGWTLPFLLGVHRVAVVDPPEAPLERVETVEDALAAFEPSDGPNESDAWRDGVRAREDVPRIGVYSPWRGSMDEGWMRWFLEHFEVPYTTVRNEALRAGRLADVLDVLVLPGVGGRALDVGRPRGTVPPRYEGGLDPEGAVAIDDFVRRGGTLVAVEGSARWAIELLDLPLEDATRGEGAGDFSCPGSVLRAVPEEHELTEGLPASLALFFSRSSAWRVLDEKERAAKEGRRANGDEREIEVLLRYAPTRVLLSGWIRSPETIAGEAAWVRASHGDGRVHLFAFRPQYRGWSQQAFLLLLRALLVERG